jgi:hypothetical protein
MPLFGRSDGRLATDVPAYRRMMPFLLRGRNEAAVYFEQTLDMSQAAPWLESFNQGRDPARRATPFHLVLAALARVLHERPRLNRFVAGGHIYDRRGVFLSFAAKKRLDDDAPLAVVKREHPPGERLAALIDALADEVAAARADAPSPIDREVGALLRLPAPLLGGALALFRWLDARNLAPPAMLTRDPMYTSAFVANLGSLKLDAAYHHLYEHGTCPLFVTVGALAPTALPGAGGPELRPALRLRYTFDERIEDGLYCARGLGELQRLVEDPAELA